MRHRETAKPHGLVRFVHDFGEILEATFKQGQLHGLSIEYFTGVTVNVALYKDGSEQARFDFDREFKEI